MTRLWPEDWRDELAKAFDDSRSILTVEVVFIGPDGNPVGEPIEITAGVLHRAEPLDRTRFDPER